MSSLPAASLQLTLSYICEYLYDLGLPDLTPEVFWQAKFEAQVNCQLLKTLHNLLVLISAEFPDNSKAVFQQYWEQIASEHVHSTIPHTGLQFICSQLVDKGYPRVRVLAASVDLNGREVLLAFGWLLAQTHALEYALTRRLLKYNITSSLPPYPQDGLQSDAAERHAANSSLLARQHLQQVLQVCSGQKGWHQVQFATHHAMMLQSKCKAKVKSLQAFHQAQCKLSHSLTQLQSTNQSKLQNRSSRQSSSITPYEWSLLQSEEKLRQHEDSLAAAACIAEDCRQAQHHAAVFFDWLSSLHKQHGPAESVAQQAAGKPWLQGDISLAALPQLQDLAPRLQTKLHAAMQSVTQPVPGLVHGSGAASAGPMLCQIQQEVASLADQVMSEPDTSVAVLPPDIQQKICDVKQKQEAARLPWHNFQLDAATMTQHKLVQHASLARSGSSYDADAETDRQATALHDINSKSDFACPWVDMGTLR